MKETKNLQDEEKEEERKKEIRFTYKTFIAKTKFKSRNDQVDRQASLLSVCSLEIERGNKSVWFLYCPNCQLELFFLFY